MDIILAGRTDVEDYFRISGVFDYEQLNHTPFLVFIISGEMLKVQVIDSANGLLAFPDETPVMGQWQGDYRSDFFQFKVGQYRQYLEAKDAALVKTVRQIVKRNGPLGGFRSLSSECTNENGKSERGIIYTKVKAERLEALFIKNGIPVEIKKEAKGSERF